MGVLLFQALLEAPSFAQVPSASSNAAANAAGTTVNNQNNSQINTSAFYGFGPGINCPTPTFALSGFSGNGSGASNGDVLGASVSSSNYGGIATVTVPLGGANQEICKEIGKAQVQALMSQVERSITEANKTQADINLVTAIKCVELQRVATLTGLYSEICRGVTPFGQQPLVVQPRKPVQISSTGQGDLETAALIKAIPLQTGVNTRNLKSTSKTNQLTANSASQSSSPAASIAVVSRPAIQSNSTTIASSTTSTGIGTTKAYPSSVLARYE